MADSNVMKNAMIKVEHVYKRYGTVHALEDLSLEVQPGAVYGLIVPNGAGKTTLLRILAALLSPSAGLVWLDGEEVTRSPVSSSAIRRKVGYMPDFFGVYPDLTSAEYLEFYAGISGVARRNHASAVKDLLELVNLSDKRDAPVETLSRGMKQRLCLARALVHDPEVLLLDEPASGLDPRARVELRELVRTLQGIGKTIIVSSHILPELAEMCTDIAIIQSGKLVIAGSVETVAHQIGGGRQLEIRILEPEHIEEAIKLLKNVEGMNNVTRGKNNLIQADFNGDDEALNHVLVNLITHDIPIISFAPRSGRGRLERDCDQRPCDD